MNIIATSPSFQGFIKLRDEEHGFGKYSKEPYIEKKEIVPNTNSIQIEYKERAFPCKEDEDKYKNYNMATVKYPGGEYFCNDYQALQKAIKLAELNPGKIIDVDSCSSKKVDYKI